MVWCRLSLSVLISIVVFATYPVQAADDPGDPHERHHHRGWHKRHPVIIGGGYGVPVVIPGLGTYAGTTSALKIRGHGTYFFVDGHGNGEAETPVPPPNAKVIHVGKEKSSCAYENGVCVIRP